MIHGKYVVGIIPARGGSKRLKHKNIYPVWGKPMLFWSAEACRQSQYIDEVYVSSEDDEILCVALECGAVPLKRPEDLAGDTVFKMHAISDAAKQVIDNPEFKKPDIVVCLQANSPEMNPKDLDAAIEKMMTFSKQEIFSVDDELNQNAAFRILSLEATFQKDLSTNCGVYITNYRDVHTIEDVEWLEKNSHPNVIL